MNILRKVELYKGRFATMWGSVFLAKNGTERMWEWIEKKNIAYVFPITKDKEVILIKSFRLPLEKYVIETPAGLADDPSLSNEEIAKKELLEETGYKSGSMNALPVAPNSAGITNGIVYGFIATDCEFVTDKLSLEDAEDIQVIKVPAGELTAYLLALPDGEMFDPKILGAFEMAKHLGHI